MPKNTADQTATNVLDAFFDTAAGGIQYQADVAGSVVDQLIGTDPHALVRSIPGVPESMVEMLSDGLVNVLKAQVLKKLAPESTE